MKITLIDDDKESISLTDEGLDNDNFVQLEVNGTEVFIPLLDELLSAIHAFEQKRMMRITRENKYQE